MTVNNVIFALMYFVLYDLCVMFLLLSLRLGIGFSRWRIINALLLLLFIISTSRISDPANVYVYIL